MGLVVKKSKELTNLGKKIRKARLSKGYSQMYMAKTMQLSRVTYIAIEKGTSSPRWDKLVKISKLLEIQP